MTDKALTDLVPLREAADLLPRRQGRAIHITTLYRWARDGVAGVQLETTKLGGILYTSREALDSFLAKLNAS